MIKMKKHTPTTNKLDTVGIGQFPSYTDGRLVRTEGKPNVAFGLPKGYMSREIFKKSPEEKVKLATIKSNWNTLMRLQYGDNWKARKGAYKVYNPSVRLDKQTGNFILI